MLPNTSCGSNSYLPIYSQTKKHTTISIGMDGSEPLGDGDAPLRAESALRVDVQATAAATTLVKAELASDRELMAKLRLSCSELAIKLCDRSCFDTT